jgi:Dullard-like phosphatase family protein
MTPPRSAKRHLKKPSDSCIPQELMYITDNPMKVSVYRSMTLHIFHSINIIKQIKEVAAVEKDQEIQFTMKKQGFKKLLIFDLDETLIHCQREELLVDPNDSEEEDEFKFVPEVYIDITTPESGEVVKTGFTIRPYALECLRAANQYYEVAIFTAGFDWYANPIIDYLDPTGELVQHRFFRHHATYLENEGFFVKDLRVFKGIDLKDVLIIDNYVYSFAFHLENGIPIVPFYGEKDDTEMIKVIKYIASIHDKEDLRVPNNQIFQLTKILNSNIESFIKHYSFDVISDLPPCDDMDMEEGQFSMISSHHSMDDDERTVREYDDNSNNDNEERLEAKIIISDVADYGHIEGEKGGTSDKYLGGKYCESCGSYREDVTATADNGKNSRKPYISSSGSKITSAYFKASLAVKKLDNYKSSINLEQPHLSKQTTWESSCENIQSLIKPPNWHRKKLSLMN